MKICPILSGVKPLIKATAVGYISGKEDWTLCKVECIGEECAAYGIIGHCSVLERMIE